jgi:hypothetical protein
MKSERPPIVTMDAGANVHLLVPTAEAGEWRSRLNESFAGFEILSDEQGEGAQILAGQGR